MVNWVVEGRLARGPRLGYHLGRGQAVAEPIVEAWSDAVKKDGVRSMLCLMAREHLDVYTELPGGLFAYDRARGFEVEHLPVADHKRPPLDHAELDNVLVAFRKLPEPVLVHCSAGIDRTGAVVAHLLGAEATDLCR